MSDVYTLKHLAREFSLDPYKLRMALRAAELAPPGGENAHWRWPDKEDPHLAECRKVAKTVPSIEEKKS